MVRKNITDDRKMRRSVKKLKFFNDDVELDPKTVCWRLDLEIKTSEEHRVWTADEYHKSGGVCGPRTQAGKKFTDRTKPLTYDDMVLLRVTRTVQYIAKPNPHICDWRCQGAKPGGECWCSCEGRNHGRTYISAEIA